MTSARIESSLPGEIEAEPEPLVQDVEVSLIVQVTAVAIPSSWRVNVREWPAPGAAVSLTARCRATMGDPGESCVTFDSVALPAAVPAGDPNAAVSPRPSIRPRTTLTPSAPAGPAGP